MFGFVFDWAIIIAIGIEMIGCGFGCFILRESGTDADQGGDGFATGIVLIFTTIISLLILRYWNHFYLGDGFWWCWDNWLIVLGVLVGYIVVGVITSILWLGKWMRERVTNFKIAKKLWLDKMGSEGMEREWKTHLHATPRLRELGELPEFDSYRAYLGRRIAWWPLYLINWIICDLFRDTLNTIGRLMADFASLFRKFYERFAASYLRELKS